MKKKRKKHNFLSENYDWKIMREKPAFLALADGTIIRGYSVGAPHDAIGEVVFNTGMTGYQEIITDPSYNGQIVTMTYTEIGNTGINIDDMESRKIFVNGFIMHQRNAPSNWRAKYSLSEFLVKHGIPALAGVDTRALTIKLRTHGTMKAYLAVEMNNGRTVINTEEAIKKAREWPGLDGQDYAIRVTSRKEYVWDINGRLTASWGITEQLPPTDLKVVAYDFGIKWNILRNLRKNGMDLIVVPATTPASVVLKMKPDGVFFSNGPADPSALTYAIENILKLIGKVPMMGICLGHQLFGLAVGGRTYRLKFGHHGCNHPVKDLETTKVEITSQNHNFAVDPDSLDKSKVEITHINLNDMTVEGLRHKREPLFSVQYHPESAPGPHDSSYLFSRFRNLILHA